MGTDDFTNCGRSRLGVENSVGQWKVKQHETRMASPTAPNYNGVSALNLFLCYIPRLLGPPFFQQPFTDDAQSRGTSRSSLPDPEAQRRALYVLLMFAYPRRKGLDDEGIMFHSVEKNNGQPHASSQPRRNPKNSPDCIRP